MENDSHSVDRIVCERAANRAPVRSEEEAEGGAKYTGDHARSETDILDESTRHDVHGPLGSTFHILRADPGTVATLAAVDWNRHFRRVCINPARGLITLMSPSFPHEKLSDFLGHVVDISGEKLAGTVEALRSIRLP